MCEVTHSTFGTSTEENFKFLSQGMGWEAVPKHEGPTLTLMKILGTTVRTCNPSFGEAVVGGFLWLAGRAALPNW